MKVVLVYPPIEMHRFAYNVKAKHRKYGHIPPIGIGYVAAIAEKYGHEVAIVDAVSNGYDVTQCVEAIKKHQPDLIGMSVMTNVKDEASILASHLKRSIPGVPIVVGGTHAYYFFADILKEMPDVDFVLSGEIENSFGLFLTNLNDPSKWSEVGGLCYRNPDGSIEINEVPDIVKNIDDIPLPSWHLYDFSLYEALPFQSKDKSFFTLITSRGCVYGKCTFCYQAGRKKQVYRRHSPSRVVSEMKILHDRHNVTDITFWDDTFSSNIEWLKEFRDLLKKESLKIDWTCSTKVSLVTREKLMLMKEAGCWSIFFGIETGDKELLKSIDKGTTIEQARVALKLTNELGIESKCAYMLGLPGETPEKAKKTIDLAIELDSTYAIFFATYPRYGTKLYDTALSQGSFHNMDFKGMTGITYVPDGYKNGAELKRMIRHAYTKFYLRPSQIAKYLKKIRSPHDIKRAFFGLELFLGLRD